jgi:diguanylate cyclase (GGDEF)-like protein
MRKPVESLRYDIIALCLLLAVAVFLFDISVPLGISVAALYSLIILLSLLSTNTRVTLYIAVGCSLLLVAGIFVSSALLVPPWIVLVNRTLYLVTIWITAILGIRLENAQQRLKMHEAQLQETNHDLEDLARHDSMTGVANRRYFDEELELECGRANRGGSSLALLMIDVDFFKPYNDIKGHQAGDVCLTSIAQAIQNTLRRPGDLVARYGGEEFAVILPVTTPEGAIERAEDIRQAVRQLAIHNPAPQVNGPITISVGVSCIWPGVKRAEPVKLISAADAALYRAKNDGRNCVRIAQMAASPLEIPAGRSQ